MRNDASGNTRLVRREVCSPSELKKLSTTSSYRGAAQLLAHVAAIAATAIVVWQISSVWWLLIPVQLILGILITFLFCPLHECVHKTVFSARRTNEIVGHLLGFVVFLPYTWFRHFHLEHHRHTHVEGLDPELASPKPATRVSFLIYLTGLKSFWWSSLTTIFKHAGNRVTDSFVPDAAARSRIVLEARLLIAGYAAIAAAAITFQSWVPLLYWIVPMVLSAWSLRLYLLAEHTLLPHGPDMLINTRTIRSNGVVKWLSWQMPYHCAHHVFPSVPFHNLSRVDELLAGRNQAVISGYAAFLKTYWTHLSKATHGRT